MNEKMREPSILPLPIGAARAEGLSRGDMKRFITLADLAGRLRMDRRTVRRWLDRAGVPRYTFGPGRNCAVRYDEGDVERFLQACRYRTKGGWA